MINESVIKSVMLPDWDIIYKIQTPIKQIIALWEFFIKLCRRMATTFHANIKLCMQAERSAVC